MIEIRNLTKKFGNFTAVDRLSMTINTGEFFGLLALTVRENHHYQYDEHRSSSVGRGDFHRR